MSGAAERCICAVCGKADVAGLGMWACHADEDITPVHTGGPADNGFSREVPPSPYVCSRCEPEPIL